MKKTSIIIMAALGIFAMSSCDKFLDIKPTNSGDSASAIKTAADADVMMNGIMSRMTSSSYYGRNMFVYADAKGGDLTIYAQGRGNDALYSFNHSPNSGSYSGFWTVGYDIILQLNNLLANISRLESGSGGEDFGNVKGQAYTLRALLYFDLVRLYGLPYTQHDPDSSFGVPDIVEVLDASAQPLRATVAENYRRIVSDLEEGAKTVSKKVNTSSNGYVTYWANRAIAARVYLTMGNYPKALEMAEEVISSGEFSLYSNDEWVASWSTQFGDESIFELAMYVDEGDLGNSSLGVYYSRLEDYSSRASGYFGASDYFLERLQADEEDVRLGIMSYDELSESYDSGHYAGKGDRLGSCYKYLGGVSKPGDGKDKASAVNVKVIRLSEMYLIAAEAALACNDREAAAGYLQEIRKRAPNLEPASASNIDLEMILDEKSKELFGEGARYWDMLRLGRVIEYNDEHLGFSLSSNLREKTIDTKTFYKVILPVFIDEINANPGIGAQQNPGY